MPGLLVFGSINLDIGIPVPRLPAPGETLLGAAALVVPGGKGANQAHAARRFGCDVTFVGAVGDDAFGTAALRRLALAGVDLTGVRTLGDAPTGLACIAVTPDAGNAIVVSPGANGRVSADWVPDRVLHRCDIVLLQMEVPVAESMALARRAKRRGASVVLNLAPAHSLEAVDFGVVDWLLLNETELAQLSAPLGRAQAAPETQAAFAATHWDVGVVLTRGAAGALLCTPANERVAHPALPGGIIDTTGAGDTLAGVFAAALVNGCDPASSLRYGVAAASLACRRPGAQAAQPYRGEIEHHLQGP